jgi:rhodanese-related sulfurtransferase
MNLASHTLQLASRECLSAEHAGSLLARGGQLVDIRSPEDFLRDAFPGAMNLPMEALCYDYKHLDKREPVILYGNHGVTCVRAARLLAGQGFERIYFLMTPITSRAHAA